MDFQQIIAGTVGKENTYGTCVGKFTDDPLDTFGGAGVVHIPRIRSCCATSASRALSITSPPTWLRSAGLCTRLPAATWGGLCTRTTEFGGLP